MERTDIGSKSYIVNQNEEILILRRSSQETHGEGEWEVPGGKREEEQSIRDALEREVEEETGLEIQALEPFNTWYFQKSPEIEAVGVDFLCRPTDQEVELSDEHDQYRWSDREEIEKLEFYGSIKQSILQALKIYKERYD